ncbi:hypothetical protein [Nonomuraea sp. 10N515B]|uniref:hypothetical protein n=1 Tax=Nonomuraea sp. 10N515B TaxID=3457422 RepID=UPI003FCCEBF7
MATTITSATTAPVLREAADRVAGLPYARVVRTDVHRALWQSASQYDIAQAALEMLASHLQATGGAEWLNLWASPRNRDEVAAEMRAAADMAEQAEAGDRLATADQSFDWTRKLNSQVRADVTTWLEVGDRAFGFVQPVDAPVQVPGGEG